MPSKYSIAERVRKILQPRISTEAKVNMQQAIAQVGNARDSIVRATLLAAHSGERYISKSNYISEYGWDVPLSPVWNSDANMWEMDMPARPIGLPYNSGIVDVTKKGVHDFSFVQVQPFSGNLYSSLAASSIPRPKFFQKNNKMYFGEDDVNENTNIIISMIASSRDIGDRDELPIDPSMEGDIIKMAVELYLTAVQPEDIQNDMIGQ